MLHFLSFNYSHFISVLLKGNSVNTAKISYFFYTIFIYISSPFAFNWNIIFYIITFYFFLIHLLLLPNSLFQFSTFVKCHNYITGNKEATKLFTPLYVCVNWITDECDQSPANFDRIDVIGHWPWCLWIKELAGDFVFCAISHSECTMITIIWTMSWENFVI